MPNAVGPRTPTDKGAVENGVGALNNLKKGLRGRDFGRLNELQPAAGAWMRAMNVLANALSGKRPDDLIADERRGPLPEAYPIAAWSEHRVRTACHVQVRSNFYSVPHEHVGKRVVARVEASTVTGYVASKSLLVTNARSPAGRVRTVTDRRHDPEQGRKATQEIRRERVDRIRSVGGGTAAFFAGVMAQREHVHSDALRALMALVEQTNSAVLDRACARAAHFGNFSLGALREIIDRKHYEMPLDNFVPPTSIDASAIVTYRPVEAYAIILGRCVMLNVKLRRLRLGHTASVLEAHHQAAIDEKLGYLEFPERLLDDEPATREHKGVYKRLRAAHFPVVKTLEEFDFDFQPSLGAMRIKALASCEFVAKHETILFVGPPGVGKVA